MRFGRYLLLICMAGTLSAQTRGRIELGRLQTDATVSFTRSTAGEWGLEIAGGSVPRILQPKPARLEVLTAEQQVRELATGYERLRKSAGGIDANAEISYGDTVIFRVQDHWSVGGAVLSMRRRVEVVGNAPGGFDSAVLLMVDGSVLWSAVNFMVPGAVYGDPSHNGERSLGGTLNNAAHRYQMREDFLPAPLFALSFQNGASVAVLDPSPRGDSTFEETKLTQQVMTDACFQFGALGAWQVGDSPIQFGFWFPGSVSGIYLGGPPHAKPKTVRRYHPIQSGVTHTYEVRFRFGQNESFSDMTRNTWRWAWNTLNPAVTYIDVEQCGVF